MSRYGHFNEVYALKLQMEGEGNTPLSLEVRLSIHMCATCKDTGTMGLRLERRLEGPTDENYYKKCVHARVFSVHEHIFSKTG